METRSSTPSSPEAAWTANDLRTNPHETADKAERVRSMFAAIARRYDLNNRLHSFGLDQLWRRRTVELCGVGPTDDVLDVACGTGDLAEAFASAGPRSVLGVDFTEPMLEIARAKAASRTWRRGRPRPRYEHGDATALDLDDASVDIVSIAFGIRNVQFPERALREFRRVLRPGGRLAVLEFSEPRNGLLRALNHIYTNRIMPVTATVIARDRSGAYRYLPRSVTSFLDRDEFAQLLISSGFNDVAQHPMTFGTCVAYIATVAARGARA